VGKLTKCTKETTYRKDTDRVGNYNKYSGLPLSLASYILGKVEDLPDLRYVACYMEMR